MLTAGGTGNAVHNPAARRIHMGRAHAVLVIDADGSAQGWCQYGSLEMSYPALGGEEDVHGPSPGCGRTGRRRGHP